jgi:hypothetical protein
MATNGVAARYIALSYCWGGAQKVVTRTDNIEAHKRYLPMDALSQSIVDAITVCRNLNFRYLWGDALCIVQDDEKEKLADIALMHEIYKKATVTIVAASAKSAEEGFLRSKPLPSCSLPYSSASNKPKEAVISPAVIDVRDAKLSIS